MRRIMHIQSVCMRNLKFKLKLVFEYHSQNDGKDIQWGRSQAAIARGVGNELQIYVLELTIINLNLVSSIGKQWSPWAIAVCALSSATVVRVQIGEKQMTFHRVDASEAI